MGCHVLNWPLTLMDPLLEQALYQPEGPQSHNSSLQLKGPLWQITMPFSSSPFPVLDLPTPPLTQPWCAWKGRQLDPSLSPTGGHPTNSTAQQQARRWQFTATRGSAVSRSRQELVLVHPPWNLTVNTNASPFLFRWLQAQFQPFLLGSSDGR